jgi:hypothetical protein
MSFTTSITSAPVITKMELEPFYTELRLAHLSAIPSKIKKKKSSWEAERLAFNRDFDCRYELFVFMKMVQDATRQVRQREWEQGQVKKMTDSAICLDEMTVC